MITILAILFLLALRISRTFNLNLRHVKSNGVLNWQNLNLNLYSELNSLNGIQFNTREALSDEYCQGHSLEREALKRSIKFRAARAFTARDRRYNAAASCRSHCRHRSGIARDDTRLRSSLKARRDNSRFLADGDCFLARQNNTARRETNGTI